MKYPIVRFIIPLLSLLILFQQNSLAADWEKEYCTGEKTVCMKYEQNGKNLDIYLRNKFPFDGIITTVTLEHTGKIENLKSHTTLPLTIVCKGTDPLKVASFTIIDTGKSWNTRLNWYSTDFLMRMVSSFLSARLLTIRQHIKEHLPTQ
jgi:hypothetical protein